MSTIWPVLVFATCAVVAAPVVAQGPCNNTGRVVGIVAGDHNFSYAPCGSFSVSVAGQVVAGPAQCLRGGANYAGTVYLCQGTVNLTHCTNKGFKVSITTYSDGGCPDISGLIPGATFASWAAVPAAVRAGLHCVPPRKHTTFDWSASVSDCPTGARSRPVAGTIGQGAGGAYYCVVEGAAYAATGPANPFATAYDLAEAASPAVVQGLLGSLIVPLHPRIGGARLTGTVAIEHIIGGVSELQTVSVDGAVLANGRFDLRTVTVVPVEGKAEPYGRQVSCDGNALYVVWDDSLHGNIWSETTGGLSARLGTEVPEVWPLHAWVEDPFDVPWFAEITYSESALGAETIVRRSFDPVVGEGIDTEYSIDTGGPVAHPTWTRVYDLSGRLVSEAAYGDYQALQPGTWRPFKVVQTRWLSPGQSDDRIVVSLNLTSAKLLPEAEQAAVPKASPDSQLWFHWL